MYTENTYETEKEAREEAEKIFGEGECLYPQVVMRRPSGTYYVAAARRFWDLPQEDTLIAR